MSEKPEKQTTVEQLEKDAQNKYPGPTDFVHLHTHSRYSTLDGVATPEQYMERCAQVGHKAFALTDHGSLAGVPDAYFAAKKHNIKYLAGCEIYLNNYHQKMREYQSNNIKLNTLKLTDPEFVERYRRNRHLTVICKNMTGYQNLLHLMQDAHEMGLYYKKPRTWYSQLEKYREGLIVLSGCLNGPVCHELRAGSKARNENDDPKSISYYKKALEHTKILRDMFDKDFYLELQMPGITIEGAEEAFLQLSTISKKFNIPTVMTGDIHYLHKRDFELQKALMAVEQGLTIDDPNLFHVDSDEGFFKTRAQFRQTFYDHGYNQCESIELFEKSCDNTVEIAERCSSFEPDVSPKLPEIPNADNQLRQLVVDALVRKGLHKDKTKYLVDGNRVTYAEQLKIELDRIIEKRFSSYFLITQNLIQYARNNNYDLGPGRGSAGGSLVCHLLGINDLDPIKWGLSFDRFLSLSRGGYMLKVEM